MDIVCLKKSQIFISFEEIHQVLEGFSPE